MVCSVNHFKAPTEFEMLYAGATYAFCFHQPFSENDQVFESLVHCFVAPTEFEIPCMGSIYAIFFLPPLSQNDQVF